MDIWEMLYREAIKVCRGREVSPFVEAGEVAAALVTKAGNIYVGVCIDTACSLGMCAERNAIASMVTYRESKIDKLIVVQSDGTLGMPCGACRELMMQLDEKSGDIEIMTDLQKRSVVRLRELTPDWWGSSRFEK